MNKKQIKRKCAKCIYHKTSLERLDEMSAVQGEIIELTEIYENKTDDFSRGVMHAIDTIEFNLHYLWERKHERTKKES